MVFRPANFQKHKPVFSTPKTCIFHKKPVFFQIELTNKQSACPPPKKKKIKLKKFVVFFKLKKKHQLPSSS